MTVVLALSFGTAVGWTVGDVAGAPSYGTWRLTTAKVDQGRAAVGFENELIASIKRNTPNRVIVSLDEALYDLDVEEGLFCVGLNVMTQAACHRWRTTFATRSAHAVRTSMLGREVTPRRFAREALTWCQRNGWFPPDVHSAGAAVLWAFEAKTRGAR